LERSKSGLDFQFEAKTKGSSILYVEAEESVLQSLKAIGFGCWGGKLDLI